MYEILEDLREDVYLEIEEQILPESLVRSKEALNNEQSMLKESLWHIHNMEGQRFLVTTKQDDTQAASRKKNDELTFDGRNIDRLHDLLANVCESYWAVRNRYLCPTIYSMSYLVFPHKRFLSRSGGYMNGAIGKSFISFI